MEGLKVSDANIVVYLHPSKSKGVSRAVLRELSSLLFKFNESFDGVVLAYDVQITDKYSKILPGIHPYFGVRLTAKLLLFSPKPNMLLEGKVVKLKQESIHVIVLGFASAIITETDIRDEFKFKIKHGEEVFVNRSHKQHVMKVGTTIRFLVKSFDEEILHIGGSLAPSYTGEVCWLEKNLKDGPLINRGARRSRDTEGASKLQDDVEITGEQSIPLNENHQVKKSKKQRVR